MRRLPVLLTLFLLLILAGCEEESLRTRIILRNIDNTFGYPAYAAVSREFFTPGGPVSVDLATAVIPANTALDVVVMDSAVAVSAGQPLYLYLFADTNSTGTVEDGFDSMLQVIEIHLAEGDTVELFDLVLDAAACYTLNRNERFWITIDNQLPFTVDRFHPVYVITQLLGLGSNLTSPTFNQNYSYLRLTDPRAVNTVVGFLSSNTHYVFAFYDMNNDGIPNSGDYGSEINPAAVTAQMFAAGDAFRTLTLSTMNLIP